MIPFNFIYYRPDTLGEAVETYTQLAREGKKPVYYAGGSEIISMCRAGAIEPDAVIDIKNIPDCMILAKDEKKLHIGAACTLSQIKESKLSPLLGHAAGRIADHTNQCRITLGGNLCGSIIYRETSLPLLVADADITIFGPAGERTVAFSSVFNGRIHMAPAEMIVKVHISEWAMKAKYFHIKKTACEKIDYPLVSVTAIIKDGRLLVALSGVCSYPFRGRSMEAVLNDRNREICDRAEMAATLLPEPAHSDPEASGEYRAFALRNTFVEILEALENDTVRR
jgi:CO/xanthine dehydrogenase FAD-binding subunit